MIAVFLSVDTVFVLMSIYFAWKLFEHSAPGTTVRSGNKYQCGPVECGVVASWIVFLIVLLITVYGLAIRPSCELAGDDVCIHYRNLGWAGVASLSISLLVVIYCVFNLPGNRAVGFVTLMVIEATFLMNLAVQAAVAAMLSEWSPHFSSDIAVDATISSSMDYLGGAVCAVFGLALVATFIPMVEILLYDRPVGADDTASAWAKAFRIKYNTVGRPLRVCLSALAGVALFWVAVSPIKTPNTVNLIVDKSITDKWAEMHMIYAIIAFVTLFVYILVMTIGGCIGRNCGSLNWVGLSIAVVAAVMLVTGLKIDSNAGQIVFTLGEWFMIAALAVTYNSRFGLEDQAELKAALLNWEKVEQEKSKKDDEIL